MAGKDKYGFRESFPRFLKPDSELKAKVGSGGIATDVVAQAQDHRAALQTDVTPQLGTFLLALQAGIDEARNATTAQEKLLPRITKPVMNLKATSGMFGEMMLCRVSALVLTFLEDVRRLDGDVLLIMAAYLKIAKTLLHHRIRSETDPAGQVLLVEIRRACTRYYERQSVR